MLLSCGYTNCDDATTRTRRHLRAAERSTSERQRLDMLTEHVLDVWLWTLAQVFLLLHPPRNMAFCVALTAALQARVRNAITPCRLSPTGAIILCG